MFFGAFLNISTPVLSFIGSYLLWDQVLNGWYDYGVVILFLIYLLAVVPCVAFAEHIKNKFQIPNEKKTISFNGKKFKKNTFDPIKEIPTKGILLALIIALVAHGAFLAHSLFTEIIPAILSGPYDSL